MKHDHQKLELIFHAAQELNDPDERESYLRHACEGDPPLKTKVEALLKSAVEAKAVFGEDAEPDSSQESTLVDHPVTEGPGALIGHYKLLQEIGQGGMGVVYMAEQKEPVKRRVALKIIKQGMDTKQVIARFEAERQALAMMDHPNIAKVLDAGTTNTGGPYFVMELVRGLPITEFCDQNNLTTRERLELFISACQAVQHAHQKGIIHRDIKPSNVLVTLHDGQPVAKVIDFGVAKAVNQQLTEKTVLTRYSQMIGTPEYMSPEQAEMSGLDVDTRTDVFSLGVLLYELLTGMTPFDLKYLLRKGYEGLLKTIREEQPTRPSTKLSTLGEALTEIARHRRTSPEVLCKLIRTDLDWIVMKTLEKDRNRRYESVSEFVADIKRHLNHEPVLAGRPSKLYRVRKFVRRRRVLVGAATAVAAAITIGFVGSTAMYLRAERAREREAVARFEAQTVADFLADDLLASVYPERAKSPEVTVRYILQSAARNLEGRFTGSPPSEATIRHTIGVTYQKLGDYLAAEPHLRRALQIRRSQVGEEDRATLASASRLGYLFMSQGRYAEAEPLLVQAMEARTRVLGEEHPETIESLCRLGWLRLWSGDLDSAGRLLERAMERGRRILGEEHPAMLDALQGVAFRHMFANQADLAEPIAGRGLEVSSRVLGEEHETTLHFMYLLAWAHQWQEHYDLAKEPVTRALEISQRVVGEEHLTTIQAMSLLGWLHTVEGHHQEAMQLQSRAIELSHRVLGKDHLCTIFFTTRLADLYGAMGQDEKWEALLTEQLRTSERVLGREHALTKFVSWRLSPRPEALSRIARWQYQAGAHASAVNSLSRKEELCRILKPERIELTLSDMAVLAVSLHRLGRDEEAQDALRRLREMSDGNGYVSEESWLWEAERAFAREGSQEYQLLGLILKGELDQASDTVARLQAQRQQHSANVVETLQGMARALARAYCRRGSRAEGHRDFAEAIRDYEASLKVSPDYATAHDRLACLLAICQSAQWRNGLRATEHASKACELTDWKEPGFLSTLAAACAETGDFPRAVQYQKRAMALRRQSDPESPPVEYESRLRLYVAGRPYRRSMVARWDFEQSDGQTILDSSGHGLHGRLVGDAQLVYDAARAGRVLALDGEGDWVDCGAEARFDMVSEITIACWIKVTKFNRDYQTIISKGDQAWRILRNRTRNELTFACVGTRRADGQWPQVDGKTNVNDGRWHHIVGIYDGTKIALYVDGELDASAAAYGRINTSSFKVLLGENDEIRNYAFDGFLDDIRIYDYALTAAEIRLLCGDAGVTASDRESP